jgi:hypothetical protein
MREARQKDGFNSTDDICPYVSGPNVPLSHIHAFQMRVKQDVIGNLTNITLELEAARKTPVCKMHEGTVHAMCGGESVMLWGIGPEGTAQAIENCNYGAKNLMYGLDWCPSETAAPSMSPTPAPKPNPVCKMHEGTVHAMCGGESVMLWGIGPEGAAQAS